jgi:hypothetical protein
MAKPEIEIKRGSKGAAGNMPSQPARPSRSIDRTVRRGVGIKSSTWDEIQRISDAEGLADNAVMKFAIEYFVEHYNAGPAKKALQGRKVTRQALS